MNSEAAYFPDALAGEKSVRADTADSANLPGIVSPLAATVAGPEPAASDEQLMKDVRDGAKEALGVLFRRHARAVRNIAYRILRDEAEADDLVQEVFLLVFRKASLYDPAFGRAATWIIHVAYRQAFDRRRYLNARRFYSSDELKDAGLMLADPRQNACFEDKTLEGMIGRPSMARFNSRLTPEQRETIQLSFDGYKLKEIAELTGRSLSNVRSHYYRGLERLRKYVLPEKLRSK
jgi:RNA polymerase sigma-70 factor (ECF subfamily)